MSDLTEFSSHKQLRNLVADKLREAILEGTLAPGEWLRQERIAQDYGVSQMPVREAFKQLAAEGLVEHLPYRGMRVLEFTVGDIEDLYASRAVLEGRAARAAARNITAEELSELEVVAAHMEERLGPAHIAEYRELNRRFHLIITIASRRAYLMRTLSQLWASFPTMMLGNFAKTVTAPIPDRSTIDVSEHQSIIAALKNRNAEEAERLVRHHIEEAGQQLVDALRTQ